MIFSIKNGRKFRLPVVHTPVSDMKYPMNSTCSIRFYPKSHAGCEIPCYPNEISAETCTPVTWKNMGKSTGSSDIVGEVPVGIPWYPCCFPWKIPTINGGFVRWENHLFLWAIYTMAMLNNQRVTILQLELLTVTNSINGYTMIYLLLTT